MLKPTVMYFVRGMSFSKKEFKRNLAGSVSFPLVRCTHSMAALLRKCVPVLQQKGVLTLEWEDCLLNYILSDVHTTVGKK